MKRLLKYKNPQYHFVKINNKSNYGEYIRLTSSGIYQKSKALVYTGSRKYVEEICRIPHSNEMFQLSLGIVKGGFHD